MLADDHDPKKLKQSIIEYWDQQSDQLDIVTKKWLEYSDWMGYALNNICHNIGKMDVLDVGTGAGLVALSISGKVHSITATDISEKMIRVAEKNASAYGADVRFLLDDIEESNLENGQFDLIVVHDVIYSLTDLEGALYNMVRLLRPGGYLVIADGNYLLHINDENYLQRHRYHMIKDRKGEYQSMMDMDDAEFDAMSLSLSHLEVNRVCRPFVELRVLASLGMNDMSVSFDDHDQFGILSENGFLKAPFRYTLACRKSYSVEDRKPLREQFIDRKLIDVERIPSVCRLFAMLMNEDRIRILNTIASKPTNVGDICSAIDLSEKMTSYHLSVMKEAGIVQSLRYGKNVYYSLVNHPALESIIRLATAISIHSK